MNITLRKLAMLEESMKAQDERARIDGYSSSPLVDQNMKKRINELMEKVRKI